MKKEIFKFSVIVFFFLAAFFLPFDSFTAAGAVREALLMLQKYARHHLLWTLVPSFFIAGAITVFINKQAVMKYFGAAAKKIVSYPVAAVSGTVLSVCSCTILPIVAGIYKSGAGLGPAIAFLYAGPAINVLAIILTARVLGFHIGLARAAGAIFFSIIIGLIMHALFMKEEKERMEGRAGSGGEVQDEKRSGLKSVIFFFFLMGILVSSSWLGPGLVPFTLVALLVFVTKKWFEKEEITRWLASTWGFEKQILPLLFIGVAAAGLLLGRPGYEGIIPSSWIESLVGGNSLGANLFASVAGAFMYFATITEVPILEGLMGAGMGDGPALALLLAGPALSLPNMLVISTILGVKKAVSYILLVIFISTIGGLLYGVVI